MNLNSPPPPDYPTQHNGDVDQPYQLFNPPCHIFFNSTQDHMGYYDRDQLYQPQRASLDEEIKKKESEQLKLTLWSEQENSNNHDPVKWMSSKMRLMQKIKSRPGQATGAAKSKHENSDNPTSYSDTNKPIRVCSDCSTTKTPLWRSGPKGPKSLCNACGIRQRKARRAMAAVVSTGTYVQPSPASTKIKLQHKGKNDHLKKRCKTGIDAVDNEAAGGSSSDVHKIGVEDFLINLSKNLSFHRFFPEDEKDAAILLMALSSGLVHH